MPGMALLLLFYLTAIWRAWPLARIRGPTDAERWAQHAACIVVASLIGFVVAAQFVTLEGLETPLYITVLAVGTSRLSRRTADGLVVEDLVVRPGEAPLKESSDGGDRMSESWWTAPPERTGDARESTSSLRR